MRTTTTTAPTSDEVVRWRRDQLRAAGFAPQLAVAIAGSRGYDLHALVERGCPPRLAVRILAPLDEETAA
jgi:hypothetical protein